MWSFLFFLFFLFFFFYTFAVQSGIMGIGFWAKIRTDSDPCLSVFHNVPFSLTLLSEILHILKIVLYQHHDAHTPSREQEKSLINTIWRCFIEYKGFLWQLYIFFWTMFFFFPQKLSGLFWTFSIYFHNNYSSWTCKSWIRSYQQLSLSQ